MTTTHQLSQGLVNDGWELIGGDWIFWESNRYHVRIDVSSIVLSEYEKNPITTQFSKANYELAQSKEALVLVRKYEENGFVSVLDRKNFPSYSDAIKLANSWRKNATIGILFVEGAS